MCQVPQTSWCWSIRPHGLETLDWGFKLILYISFLANQRYCKNHISNINIRHDTYGLPWWFSLYVQETACNARDLVTISGSGRFLGEGNGNPLQHSCLENPRDRRAWRATVHGSPRVGHNLVPKLPPWYLNQERKRYEPIIFVTINTRKETPCEEQAEAVYSAQIHQMTAQLLDTC